MMAKGLQMTKSSPARVQRRLMKKHNVKVMRKHGLSTGPRPETIMPYADWVDEGMPRNVKVAMFAATRMDATTLSVAGQERRSRALTALKQTIGRYMEQVYEKIGDDELVSHDILEEAQSGGITDLGDGMRLSEFKSPEGVSMYVELVIERVSKDEFEEIEK